MLVTVAVVAVFDVTGLALSFFGLGPSPCPCFSCKSMALKLNTKSLILDNVTASFTFILLCWLRDQLMLSFAVSGPTRV